MLQKQLGKAFVVWNHSEQLSKSRSLKLTQAKKNLTNETLRDISVYISVSYFRLYEDSDLLRGGAEGFTRPTMRRDVQVQHKTKHTQR